MKPIYLVRTNDNRYWIVLGIEPGVGFDGEDLDETGVIEEMVSAVLGNDRTVEWIYETTRRQCNRHPTVKLFEVADRDGNFKRVDAKGLP